LISFSPAASQGFGELLVHPAIEHPAGLDFAASPQLN
jgi:hypothetical protein